MNTWPGGYRRAMSQSEHDAWNQSHYPGTRQLCEECGEPTGRCEYDSIYLEDGTGPLCAECNREHQEKERYTCKKINDDWAE